MWSAAILAGGRATRFGGRDKGALLVDGRSIRERQLSELSILTTDILIVGGAASPAGDGARFVEDRLPGLGPLSGLHTALSVAAGDATVVVACDMPYLSAAFLGYLLELTCEAAAVVPQTRTGLHPLCAAYTRACLAPAAGCLAHGRLRMLDLLDEVSVRLVTTEEIDGFGDRDCLLANVNTPADYGALEALQGHQL